MDNVTPLHAGIKAKYKRGKVDPFTLDDHTAYDPDDFYCRTTDGHGHSENVQIRVPPDVVGMLHHVVNSGAFIEYGNSIQNLIRNAIIHQLVRDANRTGNVDLQRKVSLEIQLTKVAARKRDIANNEQFVKEMEELLDEAATKKDWIALAGVIGDGEDTIELLRKPYQDKANQLLKIYRGKLKDGKE